MNYKNMFPLIFFVGLFGTVALSLAMETNNKQIIKGKSTTFSGSNGVDNFFPMFSRQNTASIKERVERLYTLGDISNINILRQELKKWGHDKEAWAKVQTLGAGPTPMMIAQKNGHHAASILLYNYNRSDDPFFQAIMFGDKSKICDILRKNPEKINEDIVIDNGNCSCLPLSWAITLEDEELVKYLLKKGAKIDIKTSIGLSPFDEAYNAPKILTLMQPYGGIKLQRRNDFFEAVNKDDVKRMKVIVARNPQSKSDMIQQSVGIFTPLKSAVCCGNQKATQYLINNGALDISEGQDTYKRELFLDACLSKTIPVIRSLVNQVDHIKFYLIESLNKCPFNYYLSDEVKQELFELYKKDNTPIGQELLSLSTKLGHKDLIQRVLDEGVDINGYDSQKMTALLWACSYGNPNSVSFLIQQGADVNACDKKGRCGLRKLIRMHKASLQKQGRQLATSELLACSLLLICHGADKNIKDNGFGETPFDWITKQNFDEVDKKLVSRVFDADQLSTEDLKQLLDDIDGFQRQELKQAQGRCDEQAMYYIKKSLVRYGDYPFGDSYKEEY